jgi:hypothetical protein
MRPLVTRQIHSAERLVGNPGEPIKLCHLGLQVCFRTLDLYTSAVLEAQLDPPPAPKEVGSGVQELHPARLWPVL